jgi:hypothetical protein
MQAFGSKLLAAFMASPTISFVAIVGILLAIGLLWQSWKERREANLMVSTPTTPAADIGKLAPGSLCEVIGTLRCAAPLTAEFSGTSCAHFKAEIIKTEVWYDTDGDGKRRQQTRDTTLHSNIQHAPCAIEDASGRVAIDLRGAEIDLTETVRDTTEIKGAGAGTLGGLITGIGTEKESHTKIENTLAFDIPVYVLAEVRADGSIGAPAKGSRNKIFAVSTKSEEERTQKLASGSTFGVKFAGVLAAISALLIAWAWYKAP